CMGGRWRAYYYGTKFVHRHQILKSRYNKRYIPVFGITPAFLRGIHSGNYFDILHLKHVIQVYLSYSAQAGNGKFNLCHFFQISYSPNVLIYSLFALAQSFGFPIPGRMSCSTTIQSLYSISLSKLVMVLKSTLPLPSSQNTPLFMASK